MQAMAPNAARVGLRQRGAARSHGASDWRRVGELIAQNDDDIRVDCDVLVWTTAAAALESAPLALRAQGLGT